MLRISPVQAYKKMIEPRLNPPRTLLKIFIALPSFCRIRRESGPALLLPSLINSSLHLSVNITVDPMKLTIGK